MLSTFNYALIVEHYYYTSLIGCRFLYIYNINNIINALQYIYIYMCVCMCMCIYYLHA